MQCTNGCQLHFHCAGIKESTWNKKANKEKYECSVCKNKERRNDRHEDRNEPVSAEELRGFMKHVTSKLDGVDLKSMGNTIAAMEKTIEFLSLKYDEVMNELTSSKKKIHELEASVQTLVNENKRITKETTGLQIRLRDTEQYARNRNIEISGIEEKPQENLRNIMQSLASALDVPFQQEDIDIVHRVPSRARGIPSKIIAQFSTRSKRDMWMERKKEKRINVRNILQTDSDNDVYLNTHLCKEWKNLLWRAKQEGRPKGYHIIKYLNGKIVAKKNFRDSNSVQIVTEDDLKLLV